MTPHTYRLSTLRDVFDQVPADKIELCMREIARGMVYARDLADLMHGVAGATSIWPDVCQWIDDGKEDKTINVVDAESGERAFTFEVRSAEESK